MIFSRFIFPPEQKRRALTPQDRLFVLFVFFEFSFVMADFSNNTPENHEDFEEALKDLDAWKIKAEKADDVKSRLILEKMEKDEAKQNAQKEMQACVKQQEERQRDFAQSLSTVQDEIQKLSKHRQDLLDHLKRYQTELEAQRAEAIVLKQRFKISIHIPDKEVKFWGVNEDEKDNDSQQIKGVFAISQRSNMLLQGGQALITFEEEEVASRILKIPKCSVSCDDGTVDVKPQTLTMDPAVKFEVHLDVSRKELQVFNIISSMSEQMIRNHLEMSFCRPSRGGGEVQSVDYDKNMGTGKITFLHPGVAVDLSLRGLYRVDLDSEVKMPVGPIYKYQLHQFQTFCGAPKRTILLDVIDDIDNEEDLPDHLEIYFQAPKNYGGEIESVKYICRGDNVKAFFHCGDRD